LIQAAVGLRGGKARAAGLSLGPVARIAKAKGRAACPIKRSRSSARIKNQPGEMIPIARVLRAPRRPAQREQRHSSDFNNDRNIVLSQSETFQSLKFCNKLLQFVCCRNQAFRIQSL
jgi:hypothetical protein